ncbi:hypothetical protein [Nocardia asteroides]|uniref:hypothetical protein n=1 Tax=Nocardia asteroides TaxID=1824 RepID=UPI001E322E90|nr:hypothetical protein [Nocardia asteroides]UGT58807.1 hypothetical protein LTT85_33185 [Nocardia asteroides]
MFDAWLLDDKDDDPAVVDLDQVLARVEGLSREYDREWTQFAVWATANHRPALPAPAAVLVDYLRAHPGTLATQRGRAAAITAAHRRARRRHDDPTPITTGVPGPRGLPSPAEAEPVRRLLRPARADRLARERAVIEPVIAGLPVTGWPQALLGRRDALVLHLAVAGLSWDTIAALRQRDITLSADRVVIGSQPLIELPATGLTGTCPVAVTRRWATVLAHAPRPTGHITLEPLLTGGVTEDEPVTGLLPHWADQPLLCGFDDRGLAEGLVDELDPLTRAEVIAIYLQRKSAAVPPSVELSADWYERGVAARHRAHAAGDDLDDLLDRIEGMLDAVGDYETWTARDETS